jgi:hypothetical protein
MQPKNKGMVGWYDPFQLGKSAVQVATSTILGTRADYRVIEALATEQKVFPYADRDGIWIDYVADLGDGWNPTYTIATLLARSSLELADPAEPRTPHKTQRGDILIMGGDEVYPTASREQYQARLVAPYKCALERTGEPHPHIFAIPGNHDWYDGLVSFMRLFCQSRRFAGWRTRQTRSYFALKLPGRWWLLGTDIQLESDIDYPQLNYFAEVAKDMKESDCVILCTAKPDWVYGNIYGEELRNTLAYLEKEVIDPTGAEVMVTLAGDIHHYRRHESVAEPRMQKITAGGGGAFLHPTHGQLVDRIRVGPPGEETEFEVKAEFPSRRTSKCLAWRNLLFPVLNPRFGIVTGGAYLAVAWILQSLKGPLGETPLTLENFWEAVQCTAKALLQAPSALVWLAALMTGLILFTDTHSKPYRYIAGFIHGLAHFVAILVLGWWMARITIQTFSLNPQGFAQPLASAAGVFAGGYILGPILMGAYLLVSLNVFGRHSNEAFSSLRIQDYKNFLRLHIDKDGHLKIYPIGIKKVPRQWVPADKPGDSDPKLVPKGKRGIDPFLIEGPIEIVPGEADLEP